MNTTKITKASRGQTLARCPFQISRWQGTWWQKDRHPDSCGNIQSQ